VARLNKDTQKFVKEAEKNLATTYKKARKTTEQVVFKAQREKLYYDLGRAIAAFRGSLASRREWKHIPL